MKQQVHSRGKTGCALYGSGVALLLFALDVLLVRFAGTTLFFFPLCAAALIFLLVSAIWAFRASGAGGFLAVRLIGLLAGCLILAVGLAIELAPNVIVVPGEGIVRAISQICGLEFGRVKVRFDVTLVLIALAMSFLFFHGLRGLGLGTIVSALLVGRIVTFCNRRFSLLARIRALVETDAEESAPAQHDTLHHQPL